MTDRFRRFRSAAAWRKTFSGLAVFALFAGMLFWTKLRLVSDIPRTAYAVPETEQADDPRECETGPQPDQAGVPSDRTGQDKTDPPPAP